MSSPLYRFVTRHRWLPWAFLGVVLVMTLVVRWRLRDFPLERDEGEYAYNGLRILEGEPPYLSSYASQKYPGTYFISAVALAIWPQLPAGLRLGLAIANIGSIVLLFLLMRRLSGNFAAAISSGSYALLSISAGVLGFAAHATHFVVLFMLGGLLLLLRACHQNKAWCSLTGAGLLLGLGIVVRQPSAVFALFGGIVLFATDWRNGRPVFLRSLCFSTGVVAPVLLLFGYLWMAGVFSTFWFWTFTYAAEYGTQATFVDGLIDLALIFPKIVGKNVLIWLMAAIGAGIVLRLDLRKKAFFIGWLGSAILAVSAGLYFREHYFVQLLPVVAAFVGVAASELPLTKQSGGWWQWVAPAALAALPTSILWQADYLFRTPPVELCKRIYFGNLFPESEVVARELRARARPGDTLAIIGSEAQIYPLAGLRSATGYLYTYALTEESPFAERFQHEMIAEIEARRPRFVVTANSSGSWQFRPRSSVLILDWAEKYLTQNYRLIGVSELDQEARWDATVPKIEELGERARLVVFERVAP